MMSARPMPFLPPSSLSLDTISTPVRVSPSNWVGTPFSKCKVM